MSSRILNTLRNSLARSDAEMRKRWARQIVDGQVALNQLLGLFQADLKTAQRFTWLIGDICELDPSTVTPCMQFLFSLRDQMPFPGMRRSVAKWLWLTNFPPPIAEPGIQQVAEWLAGPDISIGCKSYSAKGLVALVQQRRISRNRIMEILESQTIGPNRAFRGRMKKLYEQLKRHGSGTIN